MTAPAFLPSPPEEVRCSTCNEPLTLECEHDIGICVDCQAEAARESEALCQDERNCA